MASQAAALQKPGFHRLDRPGRDRDADLRDDCADSFVPAGHPSCRQHHARRRCPSRVLVYFEAIGIFRFPDAAAFSHLVPHLAEHRQQPEDSPARQRRADRRGKRDRLVRPVRRGRKLRRRLRDLPRADCDSISGHQPRRGAHGGSRRALHFGRHAWKADGHRRRPQRGTINEQEARARREKIAQEAEFYGAMDGAARFSQRDALAAC